MKFFLYISIFTILIATRSASANTETDKTLNNRGLVLNKEKVEGNAWPRMTIKLLIESTPIEALAIFLALDHQKNYLPKVIKSTPVKHITPTEVLTDYELELPWPLENSTYTHGSDFKKHSDTHYTATWYMVKSTSTHSVEGSADFQKYKDQTIMTYKVLINPKSALSGIVRGFMVKDTQKSINAIRSEIEKLKKENSPLLKKYVSYIEQSLAGKNVYEAEISKK